MTFAHQTGWIRAVVVLWASVWMLEAPLVHVHPEADHRHGEAGHVHGGTVHTVWSPDLDCEFDGHPQGHGAQKSTEQDIGSGDEFFSHVGDRHTEFGLSLLSDSTDRKSITPCSAPALGWAPAGVSGSEKSVGLQREPVPILPSASCGHAIVPRAPPNSNI